MHERGEENINSNFIRVVRSHTTLFFSLFFFVFSIFSGGFVLGAVVPIRHKSDWLEDINKNPLAVLYHVGYAFDSKKGVTKRQSLKNMVRLSSPEALAEVRRCCSEERPQKIIISSINRFL